MKNLECFVVNNIYLYNISLFKMGHFQYVYTAL